MFSRYAQSIYFVLGLFVILLGAATCLGAKDLFGKTCAILNKGNIRNVGVAGLLIGFAPCLPLVGILNYVVLIAKNPWDAIMYLLVFGLGTVVSPLVFLAALSGKFAQMISKSQRTKTFFQYACGGMLVFLGARIVMGVVN